MGPPRQDAHELERGGIRHEGARGGEAVRERLRFGGGNRDLQGERRALGRMCHLAARVERRHHAPRGRGERERRGLGDAERARPGEPVDGDVAGLVEDVGETRRHRAREDGQRALAGFVRHGEGHRRAEPSSPAIHQDHPFRREQRAVQERAVSRVLEVVREQSL